MIVSIFLKVETCANIDLEKLQLKTIEDKLNCRLVYLDPCSFLMCTILLHGSIADLPQPFKEDILSFSIAKFTVIPTL